MMDGRKVTICLQSNTDVDRSFHTYSGEYSFQNGRRRIILFTEEAE